jgi:hypothetical protein
MRNLCRLHGGAVVQFHKLCAAASRAELVGCGEAMSAALKRDAETRDAAAAAAAAASTSAVTSPPPLQPLRRSRNSPLGAFAAVCNGRGEGFHGGALHVESS